MKEAGPYFMVREEDGQVVGFVNGEAAGSKHRTRGARSGRVISHRPGSCSGNAREGGRC